MELLAPAGDYASVLAAVNNGADAIYLGGKRFHARQKGVSFSSHELLKSLEYAHQRGKKVYVTLNILLDHLEVEEALEDAYEFYQMGVDGLIVQDIGLMELLSQTLPQMRVHASTQATIYHANGLRLMRELGIKRTVLARELSLEEIARLHHEVPDMELEVFVHGALCYSYSGQCLLSSLVGGRSGNRGRCAQPCRKPYRLASKKHPDGMTLPPHSRYLLSTVDQCLLESLPLLHQAGVTSLKIEGRLKKPEYVAMVTRCYRQVIDHMPETFSKSTLEQMKKDMKGMFNRDFSQDYLQGKKRVLRIDRPDNRGVLLGRVEHRKNDQVFIRLEEEVGQNDGIVLNGAHGEEISFALRQLEVREKRVAKAFPGEVLTLRLREKVLVGEKVYKTRDTGLIRRVQDSLREQPVVEANRIPLHMEVIAHVNEPLKLIAQDNQGRKAEVSSEILVTLAQKQPLQVEEIHEKLARLGKTPFWLQSLQADIASNAIFPFSELNHLRRTLIEKLEQQNQPYRLPKDRFLEQKKAFYQAFSQKKGEAVKKPLLTVHVGNIPAAETAIRLGADRVILDMEPLMPIRYEKEAIQNLVRTSQNMGGELLWALPRIHRGDESDQWLEKWVKQYPKAEFLLENWGDVHWAQANHLAFSTDYALNVFNEVTYQKLVDCGAKSVCLSVELNAKQMKAFNRLSRAEIVIHGELILMVAEGCVLYHTLPMRPDGRCPHYCAQDRYELIDEKKYHFPLAHDKHCRQYVFHSRTLCLWEELSQIVTWRPYALRIEAQLYTQEQIAQLIPIYRSYLDRPYRDEERLKKAKEHLRESASSAFTRGHYLRGVQ